jgi:hypothetical protein
MAVIGNDAYASVGAASSLWNFLMHAPPRDYGIECEYARLEE